MQTEILSGDLKTDNALLRAALDAMSEGVAFLDAQDCYVFWNRRYAEMHRESRHLRPGISLRAILEIGLAEQAYPEAIGREAEWLGERMTRHALPSSIEEQELPDGRWVRIEERRTREGGSISVAVDITELKGRETELRRTRAFLDTIVEHMPTTLMVRDTSDHSIVLINKAGEELLGRPRDEVVGRTLHELFVPEEAERSLARDREVLMTGALGIFDEEPISTLNRGLRYVQTKKVVVPAADGRAAFILAICDDITERKATADALVEALDQAQAANRAKDEFLANMSHELRTPLNGVLGMAEVLRRTPLEPRQQGMVDIIQSSAATLVQVFSDVLDMAKIEAGRMNLVCEPFEVGQTVRGVVAAHAVRAAEKGLRLDVDIKRDADCELVGDELRLKQILDNLIGNAVKFTDGGGVRVAVALIEDLRIAFQVSDTGPGFDPSSTDPLFERFSQADGSSTRRHGGSGLGLPISRDLARLMGGDVVADGAPGRGATFTLTLPLDRRRPARSVAA